MSTVWMKGRLSHLKAGHIQAMFWAPRLTRIPCNTWFPCISLPLRWLCGFPRHTTYTTRKLFVHIKHSIVQWPWFYVVESQGFHTIHGQMNWDKSTHVATGILNASLMVRRSFIVTTHRQVHLKSTGARPEHTRNTHWAYSSILRSFWSLIYNVTYFPADLATRSSWPPQNTILNAINYNFISQQPYLFKIMY
jgi:hypothetical protein